MAQQRENCCGPQFGCGMGSFDTSTLLLSIIARLTGSKTCNGIKVCIKSAGIICSPYVCTSMIEFEELLKAAISIGDDGTASVNIVMGSAPFEALPCRSGIEPKKEFANCFIKTIDGQVAIQIFNNSCGGE